MARCAAFNGARQVVQALHDFKVLTNDLGRVLFPVLFRLDEECGAPAVSIWRLYHQITSKTCTLGQFGEIAIGVGFPHDIGGAGNACLISKAGRFDLAVQSVAQLVRWQRDGQPNFLAQLFCRLVKLNKQRHAGITRTYPVSELGMIHQIVPDILHRAEILWASL